MRDRLTNRIIISLDVDISEDEATLKQYALDHQFTWIFARGEASLLRQFVKLYGQNILNPPAVPKVMLDKNGEPHQLEFGIQPAETILEEFKKYDNQ